MDHSFIVLKGLAKYSEAMSHAMQSHPDGWVIVKNSEKNIEEEMATHTNILARRIQRTV